MKKLLCLLLGALVSTSSMGAEWVYIGSSDKTTSFYMDNSSIDKNGINTKVWVRALYEKTKTSKPNDTNLVRVLHEISCSSKKQRILYMLFTNFDGSSGSSNTPSEWEYIPPDSIFEDLMQKVCN